MGRLGHRDGIAVVRSRCLAVIALTWLLAPAAVAQTEFPCTPECSDEYASCINAHLIPKRDEEFERCRGIHWKCSDACLKHRTLEEQMACLKHCSADIDACKKAVSERIQAEGQALYDAACPGVSKAPSRAVATTASARPLRKTTPADLGFEPLSCGDASSQPEIPDSPAVAAGPSPASSDHEASPSAAAAAPAQAADQDPESEVKALREQAALVGRRLADVASRFNKAKAIEEHLHEQLKVAPESQHEALRKELYDVYMERRSYQSPFYSIRNEYDKVNATLEEAEARARQARTDQENRRFAAWLLQRAEQHDKEREAVERRRAQDEAFASFQQRKRDGAIPQGVCYDGQRCRAGEQRTESYDCTYLSLEEHPTFYKQNPYALSDDDLQGMRDVYAKVGLTAFAATMAVDPSKHEVAKFIVGEILEKIVGMPVPLGAPEDIFELQAYFGQRLLERIQILQNKLGLVHKMDIPVTIKTIETTETYTCREEGPCHAVEWDKRSVPRVAATDTAVVTFACQAFAAATTASREDYDSTFSFQNSAEPVAVQRHCLPPKDPRVFSEVLQAISSEALRVVRDEHGLANSDQCPPQEL